jgi:oligoendopeptidase F
MAALFDKMFIARTKVAGNAGFSNYEDYAFKSKHRFDYSPADCRRFHDAVEQTVGPAVERQLEHRRERLGLDRVRPWDLGVELERVESLRPFDDVTTFVDRARAIFRRIDPQLGDEFDLMAAERLLDLESRKGKAPGGYCTKLSFRGKPFIFMNAVGVADDVNTLVHEAGHSFHDFAAHNQPLIWQRSPGHEAAELASMSMELLASAYLKKPDGYYSADEARSARIEHLEDILFSLPHIASVDAFQSWIYTSGEGHDAAARDSAWLEIRSRFERGIVRSGHEQERVARWYRQLPNFD